MKLTDNLVLRALERMNSKVFFLALFIYQLIFIFQGFEVTDEGFNATFYQEIYAHPASVQYNFMFWLTGMIGGAWSYLFPTLGLLGIRLAGVLVTTLTIVLTYRLLKKHLNRGYLKLGLLLTLLIISNDTKEIYYNNLSALFYILAASLLFSGLTESKNWKLFLCGAIVGLNVFIRLPSAMGVGLALTIPYYAFLTKVSLIRQLRQLILFACGGLAATATVLLAMKLIGHFDLFVGCLEWVINLGKSAVDSDLPEKSKDSSSYYGLMTQLTTFWTGIANSLRHAVMLILIGMGIGAIGKLIQGYIKAKWFINLLTIATVLALCLAVLQGTKIFNYPNLTLLYIYTGLILVGSLLILVSKASINYKLLTFIAAYITITYPFGSRGGITSAGIYCFWLSFPIIIDFLLKISDVTVGTSIISNGLGNKFNFLLRLEQKQISRLYSYAIYICIFGCLYSAYFFPFSDLSNRLDMRYSINNSRLHGILTTKERSEVVNELLAESNKYIKEGDEVLAYDAIPMFHYITRTRPYLRNSYPWLYTIGTLKSELEKVRIANPTLPVVILQRTATNSHRSIGWPLNSISEFDIWNNERNSLLQQFLLANKYEQVWENRAFKIYIPPTIYKPL